MAVWLRYLIMMCENDILDKFLFLLLHRFRISHQEKRFSGA